MRRIFYGMIITAGYTIFQYLMLTNYYSMLAHLLPVVLLGFAMSCLWHMGFKSGLERGANCTTDESEDRE